MSKTAFLSSRREAENLVAKLALQGWKIFHHRIPLKGQEGFICTNNQEERRYFWNLFQSPLNPIIIPCFGDRNLLDFIWQHARHDMSFFDTQTGQCGLTCYCNAHNGRSIVMLISDKEQELLSEKAWEMLCNLSPKSQK